MQIKVWPIHKHKWKVISFISNQGDSSYEFPHRGVNRICRCGKVKVWKFKSFTWKTKELLILAEEKGWDIHAEVYNAR